METSLPTPRGMKTFLIIWSGQLISIIGSGMTSFALGIWIFQQTRQATPFAMTVLFAMLPRILITPIAGSLADRWNRRRLMIFADTGDALVTLAAALLLFTHRLEIWHIYIIALCSSTFAAFQEPAYTASVTMLVPKKDLTRAAGLMQTGHALEMLIAPLLGGALYGLIGLNGIILIDFITYFFAIGALMVVAIPQPALPEADRQKKATVWSDAKFGWNYLKDRPGLFGLLWYFSLVNFLLNFAAVLIGPLVLSTATAGVLGIVQTVTGVGMLLGSILLSAWGGPKRRIRGVIGFISIAALGLIICGIYPHAGFVAAGMFVLLFCTPLASGPSQALFQTKVAASIQGRVFAIRAMISRSMLPLAALTTGPLADYIFEPAMKSGGALAQSFLGNLLGTGPGRGMGLMFVLSGITLLLASLLAYSNARIRNLEEELPDAVQEAAGQPEPDTAPVVETMPASD